MARSAMRVARKAQPRGANAALKQRAIVRVQRRIRPRHPKGKEGSLLHAELELTGPCRYQLTSDLEFWRHSRQGTWGKVTGLQVYRYLLRHKMLPRCLSVADGYRIKEIGAEMFRAIFGDTCVLLWKSAVRAPDGEILVPFLFRDAKRLRFGKLRLSFPYGADNLTPLFKTP